MIPATLEDRKKIALVSYWQKQESFPFRELFVYWPVFIHPKSGKVLNFAGEPKSFSRKIGGIAWFLADQFSVALVNSNTAPVGHSRSLGCFLLSI